MPTINKFIKSTITFTVRDLVNQIKLHKFCLRKTITLLSQNQFDMLFNIKKILDPVKKWTLGILVFCLALLETNIWIMYRYITAGSQWNKILAQYWLKITHIRIAGHYLQYRHVKIMWALPNIFLILTYWAKYWFDIFS